jgi:hypothetical protein
MEEENWTPSNIATFRFSRSKKWKLPSFNRTFLICGLVFSAFAALACLGSVSEGGVSVTFSAGAVAVVSACGCGGGRG